ncbi:MAG: bifunctional folylpolyglutamate synthase/dihydrofolate synthase [Bacteroidales bacterium]|nr:bifunctional folylpolyglutamate synthase/dihydrofolate synthase [Bacteroidales bacterium]
MNYKETLEFLYSKLPAYQRIGKAAYKEGLGNTLALDSYFGEPHRRFKSVHIAGTNGKGSVSHMMASAFQEAGFRTGLYTSPHLRDFRERIRINGEMIPEEEVVSFVGKHQGIIESVAPSFFELTVALAFDYFARMNVEIAVIETGMGGRLDSTNIITPLLSVITNIGHDHMEFLGDTIAKVAGEKAGIIKPGVQVVIGETDIETKPVFEEVAGKAGSPIYFADMNFDCSLESFNPQSGTRGFNVISRAEGRSISGKIPLPGDYQAHNLKTLFQAFAVIDDMYRPSVAQIISGIERVTTSTGLLGRWQVLRHNPMVICDTGHNREGLSFVTRQLAAMKYDRLHMVIGFVNDKDLASVLPLFPKDAVYYFTRAAIPRALDEKLLQAGAAEYGLQGSTWPSVGSALDAALSSANDDDLIFVGGSTFVVAEVV